MSAFTEAVEANLAGLEYPSAGICPTCKVCQDQHNMDPRAFYNEYSTGKMTDEPHFSWHTCESCGDPDGGLRYAAHAFDSDGNIVHLDVCEDCLCYLANGDEPNEVCDE